ncbi:hypothetical protein [Flavobacterium sp.]
MSSKILLPNGCSCSTPSVFPKNWKTCNKAALQKDWRIQYYFYDPNFPKPKHPIVVKGMNNYKTLAERRDVTATILDDEMKALMKRGYNPYLKKYTLEEIVKPKLELNPDMLMIDGFRAALKKLKKTPKHLYQIKCAIDRYEKAAVQLRMTDITISDLKRSHFKEIIEFIDLPDDYFNKFKSYFSSLFKELIEWECCETNITRDIQKRVIVKKQREFKDLETVKLILEHLKDPLYSFYRYGNLFLYSGGRSTELFSIQAKHVRLHQQEYDVLIKKGQQYVWETKVIIKSAIRFWTEIMKLCKSKDDFLFSHGLVPGPVQNDANQITRRWKKHVKERLVIKDGAIRNKAELDEVNDLEYEYITFDFYSLKYTFLDLLDDMNDGDITASKVMGAHRKETTTKIYTGGRDKREKDKLKLIEV